MIRKISFLLVTLFLLSSCEQIKNLTSSLKLKTGSNQTEAVEEEIKISKPCHGSGFITDTEYFRASAIGEGEDVIVSQNQALTLAKSELKTSIETTINAAMNNYLASYDSNTSEERKIQLETLYDVVINSELKNSQILCQKQLKSKDGKYLTFTTIEISGMELSQKIHQKIDSEKDLFRDFKYDTFEAELQKEMINQR